MTIDVVFMRFVSVHQINLTSVMIPMATSRT